MSRDLSERRACCHVLVVEDEVRVRTMLGQALAAMQHRATFAGSAEAARKALRDKADTDDAFDVMILDLNLPGQGGIDFLEQIRHDHADIQVIVLTGFGDLDAAKRAIRLDVADFLTKPCALGDLETALARATKRRREGRVEQAAKARPADVFDEPAARPAFAVPLPTPPGEASSIEDVERQHILAAVARHGGNRSAAAAELGISVRKLYYRLGEYQKKGLI